MISLNNEKKVGVLEIAFDEIGTYGLTENMNRNKILMLAEMLKWDLIIVNKNNLPSKELLLTKFNYLNKENV